MGELYLEACHTESDIVDHLPTFVELAEQLDARTVIELGVRDGESTKAWLYAMECSGGHLWSVDLSPAPTFPTHCWTFIQGDDLDPAVIAQLPVEADIVFIDTLHSYAHTCRELETYVKHVRRGGRIVMHDTELDGALVNEPDTQPVKKAVTEFCDAHGWKWANRTNCWGLGIIEVPE